MSLLILSILGIVDAGLYLWRLRTAIGASREMSALSAFAIGGSSVAKGVFGASAVMASVPPWAAILAYAVPAGIATFIMHPRK